MIKILFVCHGNICRSPIAEFVMKDLLKRAKQDGQFYVESAATSTEEIWNGIGNPVYPLAARVLLAHGIRGFEGKRARQLTRSDYDRFDLLIGMDRANVRNMERMCGRRTFTVRRLFFVRCTLNYPHASKTGLCDKSVTSCYRFV